jgi:hypothetical protein
MILYLPMSEKWSFAKFTAAFHLVYMKVQVQIFPTVGRACMAYGGAGMCTDFELRPKKCQIRAKIGKKLKKIIGL